MCNYDYYDNRYEESCESAIQPISESESSKAQIDTAAIAEAGARALNGPNGKDVCNIIQYALGVAGIVILTWLFKGSQK